MAERWFRPPQLRTGKDAEEERHATWLELFFDLVFVVAVAELAQRLDSDISIRGAAQFAALFVVVWWSWAGAAFYATRFDTDDTAHRLLTAVQMLAVAAMAVNIHSGLEGSSAGLALSYVVVRLILVIEYIRAGRHAPEARRLTRRYARGFGLAAAIWLASVFVAPPQRFWLWGLAIVVDFGTPLLAGQLHADLPPHTSHLPERFGLFTIIVLGESVARAIHGVAYQQWSVLAAAVAALALGIAFCVWWVYFDSIGGAAIRSAIRYRRTSHYHYWLYAHLLLALGITATGVGLERAVLGARGAGVEPRTAWLVCASFAVCLLALMIIHLVSTGNVCTRLRSEAGGLYRGVAAALVLALAGVKLAPIALMLILMAICATLVILDLYERGHHSSADL